VEGGSRGEEGEVQGGLVTRVDGAGGHGARAVGPDVRSAQGLRGLGGGGAQRQARGHGKGRARPGRLLQPGVHVQVLNRLSELLQRLERLGRLVQEGLRNVSVESQQDHQARNHIFSEECHAC